MTRVISQTISKTFGAASIDNIATAWLVVIEPLTPDLTIAKTYTGHFRQGQTGATYTISVTNGGNGHPAGW